VFVVVGFVMLTVVAGLVDELVEEVDDCVLL